MARYLARACPKCNGYVGIVLREPGHTSRLRAINGHCFKCGYRLAWILVRGKPASRDRETEHGRWK